MRRLLLLTINTLLAIYVFAQTGTFLPSDRFSSSLISTICQDRQGFIWVGTDYGLNRFDGYRFVTFLHDDNDTTSLGVNVVVRLFCDRDGQLWVGTNHGLDRFDAVNRRFIHYQFPNGWKPRVSSIFQRQDGSIVVGTSGYGAFLVQSDGSLKTFSFPGSDDYFILFMEDSRGRLWKAGYDDKISMLSGAKMETFRSDVGSPQEFIQFGDELIVVCQHGLMSYHNGRMSVSDVDLGALSKKDVVFTKAAVSQSGVLYIGTRGQGVYRVVGTHQRRLEPVSINAYGIDPYTAKVSTAIFDRGGNLWLGCDRKGVLMVPQRPLQFSSWNFEGQGMRLGSPVSSVCEGDGGMTWCTVQGVGVYGFNKEGKVVSHPVAPEAVEFIYRDKARRYWVGTDDALFAYDPSTGRSERKFSFDCDRFNDMTTDADGNLYISVYSRGLCIYNPTTGNLRNLNFSQQDQGRGRLCNNWIMSLSNDHKGLIWMGTASGVSCYDPRTDNFRSQGWNTLLDGVVCYEVCELHSGQLPNGQSLEGNIAIGTERGLYLYDCKTRKTEPFPGGEQLRNKVVSYIVQANDGDIWCSTSAGIWQYSLKTNSFVGHINGNGLTQKEYLYGVGMHTDGDVIYFGQNDGLTVFSPSRVKKQAAGLDSLKLVGFIVGGTPVSASTVLNGVQVTDRDIAESERFKVSYLDHTVTLAFSQLNYENAMNAIFEYRVNGGEWLANSEGQNGITLSQLQPGTYHIDVRACQGNDYSPVKSVVVIVRAPWYRSTLAYIFYILGLLGLIGYMAYSYRRRTYQRLDEEKMKFLINATHDIRSPLTLIMSPLEKLKALCTELPVANSQQLTAPLDTIERNAKRILDLVNQILDVRKIDKQQMHLHCQQTEMVSFVRGICKMFEFSAQERHLNFRLDSGSLKQLDVWVDRSQFDKVVSNLLSNAFKYTAENGEVVVSLAVEGQNAMLRVTDNGVGLDENSLKHIFDRFYQGDNAQRLNIKGTGIGLNLCKMIVDMHHGTIEAHNRTDGHRGSIFTVTLPLGNAHLLPEEIEQSVETPATQPTVAGKPVATGSSKFRVLIVDDDAEIGSYISTELGRFYKFHICPNGREGLKELLSVSPENRYDLVISDVMMPEMDGFTMLRMIKTNINISDIPVIMLTSMADVGNRLEGLERGADAFLAKPFNMEELHMNIENLLQSRQRLKGKYTGAQMQADKVEQPEVKGNDELLMERIMKAINKNISDSDFNVDMLTQEVGISRAQLHRKMKEMTGISTSEFLRNIRLEQAARLLREQKINVTQVAYTVGFSNLAHFSTIFRKHFGVAPSEYAEREGGQ
jgi:Signal transduction histidine kinase